MLNKIDFDDFSEKKDLIWSIKKIDEVNDTYKATIIFDKKAEIILNNLPGQYIKEDVGAYKEGIDKLDDKQQEALVERRLNTVFSQLQQLIFSIKFYGGDIKGYLTTKKEAGLASQQQQKNINIDDKKIKAQL